MNMDLPEEEDKQRQWSIQRFGSWPRDVWGWPGREPDQPEQM